MSKVIVRIVAGTLIAVVVIVTISSVSFSLWRTRYVEALESDSRVMMTARGEIEYATFGDGTPYLMLHGTPGGYDQVLNGRRATPELSEGSMTIAVSRPGYLRTPLMSGATFDEQADLFAALLDELGIDRTVVYAASGGGYAGLRFALRHPHRCIALVLYAPSVNYEPLPAGFALNNSRNWRMELMAWALDGPAIRWAGGAFLEGFADDDPAQIALARSLLKSVVPFEPRAWGVWNDIMQRDNPGIDHWPLEQIRVPTLLIHGTADENSAYAGSVDVADKVPGAKLITLEGADHFAVITRAHEVRGYIRDFVRGVCARDGAC